MNLLRIYVPKYSDMFLNGSIWLIFQNQANWFGSCNIPCQRPKGRDNLGACLVSKQEPNLRSRSASRKDTGGFCKKYGLSVGRKNYVMSVSLSEHEKLHNG
jgi:hypothetical protein